MRVCAFTSVCQEDSVWIDQYLAEVVRLQMPFFIHFDRCRESLKLSIQCRYCVGSTSQDDPTIEFTEQHKQSVLDLAKSLGFDWAMAWDIDETYELSADDKIRSLEGRVEDCLDTRWLNLWEDERHIRVDLHFAQGHRVKLYNLQGDRQWVFDHPITNGPKLVGREGVLGRLDLVCLHHGMMTHALRVQHKARWDRIYTKAVGANPYGFWKWAIETENQAVTIKHGYRGCHENFP